MSDIKLDYIVQNLTAEQLWKLADTQARVGYIQNLPSFEDGVLHDPKNHLHANALLTEDAQDSKPVQFDISLIKTKKFRQAIGDLTPQTLKEGMWKNVKHDDPDTLVVRHLQARNWDVEAALCMMFNSVRWRTENNVVDGLLGGGDLKIKETEEGATGEEQQIASEVMAQLRSGKSFTNGIDKMGRPLLFTRVSKHKPGAQGLKGFERYAVFQSESARMVMRPPITTACIIFDLGGFSMANMDWNAIRMMTLGLEDKYPESMGATYVYRAPWIIGSIWNVVKHWMPGTEAKKVLFVKDAKQLSEYVDLQYLPPDMGGTGDYDYTYSEPVAGENDLMKDTVKRDELLQKRQDIIDEYERLTWEWVYLCQLEAVRDGLVPNVTLDATATNKAIEGTISKSAEQAMKRKREMMEKLRNNYFELDPYVRGKCHGDRAGVVPIDQYDLPAVST